MSIEERLGADMKDAMRAKDKLRLEALRAVKKNIIEAKTAKGGTGDVDEATIVKIIQKLAKQGKDSANIYKEQNREDLYEQEMSQVEVFNAYLPKQLSDEELTAEVKAVIEQCGASSMKDMGKVMGIASKKLSGRADGKLISEKVKSLLA